MPRPAFIHPDMIGLEKTGRAKPPRRLGPEPEAVPDGYTPTGFGLIVETTRAAVPLRHAFAEGSIPYLRMLAGHRRRVLRELARLRESPPPRLAAERQELLPGRRPIHSLRLVNCAACGTALLGESEEQTRARAVARRMPCAVRLPPPVAARIHGRPVCADCLPRVRRTA